MVSPINIVFATDNDFVQHLSATLTSLYENTKNACLLSINVIDGGITDENKRFLEELANRYGSSIQFKKVDTERLVGLVINGHVSEATYYRILIPSLFDDSVKKVIYLDCDIIVRRDIVELWNCNIFDFALGAVRNYEYRGHKSLGIPTDASYFNAGVLIINLQEWREKNITQKALDFIIKYPERLISWDQDALNGVLYNNWQEIKQEWNVRSLFYDPNFSQVNLGFKTEDEVDGIKKNPFIVHFTSSLKPWHYFCKHPYSAEYFHYLDLSGFQYDKYPELSILESKSIVVFGASRKAVEVTEELRKYGMVPHYYVDNDSNKWGTFFEGKEIRKPSDILMNPSDLIVIIASQYVDEIIYQLEEMNLKEYKHFFRKVMQINV